MRDPFDMTDAEAELELTEAISDLSRPLIIERRERLGGITVRTESGRAVTIPA